MLFVDAGNRLRLHDRRVAELQHLSRLRHRLQTNRPREVEQRVLLHVHAVAREQLLEVVRVEGRAHVGVALFHVHGRRVDEQALVVLHQELVDAAQLFVGVVLARLRDEHGVEVAVDLGLAALQVDVLELVVRERVLHDGAHRRGTATATLARDEVRVRELDLFLAADETDAPEDVVRLVANFADLVADPELEALRAVGRQHRDHVLLVSVEEDEAHVTLGDLRLILARLRAFGGGDFLQPVVLRLLLLGVGLGVDLLVDELAAARALVLAHQVVEVARERVDLRETGVRNVRLDGDRALEVVNQPTRALGQREALGLRDVEALVRHEAEHVRGDDDRGDDEQVNARFGGRAGPTFHGHG